MCNVYVLQCFGCPLTCKKIVGDEIFVDKPSKISCLTHASPLENESMNFLSDCSVVIIMLRAMNDFNAEKACLSKDLVPDDI